MHERTQNLLRFLLTGPGLLEPTHTRAVTAGRPRVEPDDALDEAFIRPAAPDTGANVPVA